MYIVSELAIIISEIVIIHLYLQGIFLKKSLPTWSWGLGYTSFAIGATIFTFIPDAAFLRLMFFFIGTTTLCIVFFQTRKMQAVFTSFLFCAVFVLTDVLMYLLLPIFHLDSFQLLEIGLPRVIWSIASHAMTLILVLIIVAIMNHGRSAITLSFMLVITPGCAISIVLGCYFCQVVQTDANLFPLPFLLASVGLLYMNILLVFYAEQAKRTADDKMELELAEQHYLMQEQYYEQLRIEQNETRAMFHEINKYLRAMHALMESEDLHQASQTLHEAETVFERLGQVTDVGNSVVSIILNEYRLKMREAEIEFIFDVRVPPILGITAVDAYILLGNVLDNAINACCLLPPSNRYIHLQLKLFHEVLFLQVKNPFPKDYHMRTIKNGHGYGLKNVRKCIEKYGGDLQTLEESCIYELSARINIGEQHFTQQ